MADRRAEGERIRVVRTRHGARLIQDDAVLSELRSEPGPAHGVFDVLAACVAASPGPRCLVLGFAAGGLVGPLRAMGWAHPIDAVDWSSTGAEVFRRFAGGWAGEIRLARAEAGDWLRRTPGRWDLILDDLSVPSAEGVVKPDLSLGELPGLVRRRLRRGGLAVTNLLGRRGLAWRELIRRVTPTGRHAALVTLRDYQNRIVVAGDGLPAAAELSRDLRRRLGGIGSRQAGRVRVRSIK